MRHSQWQRTVANWLDYLNEPWMGKGLTEFLQNQLITGKDRKVAWISDSAREMDPPKFKKYMYIQENKDLQKLKFNFKSHKKLRLCQSVYVSIPSSPWPSATILNFGYSHGSKDWMRTPSIHLTRCGSNKKSIDTENLWKNRKQTNLFGICISCETRAL